MIISVPILEDLRKLAIRDKRTKAQLARDAGIHPKTFLAFLAGRRGLSVETAENLASVLGHPIHVPKDRHHPEPKKR